MEDLVRLLSTAIDYARQHPQVVGGVVLAIAIVYYLLQRKGRMERDAERRLTQLKREKAGHYDRLRPPH
jgi:predicted PurR-regulated permease PerM